MIKRIIIIDLESYKIVKTKILKNKIKSNLIILDLIIYNYLILKNLKKLKTSKLYNYLNLRLISYDEK